MLTLYRYITANTSAVWQRAAHITNQLLLAAKQELYEKASLSRIFWRKKKQ